MDASSNMSLTKATQFPGSLNCTLEFGQDVHDSPLPSHDDNYGSRVIEEMDLFPTPSSKQEFNKVITAQDDDSNCPPGHELKVDTELYLNNRSEKSMADKKISHNFTNKEANGSCKVEILQAELQEKTEEIHRLKDMLNRVYSKYNSLQMHMMSAMQQMAENTSQNDEGDEAKKTLGIVPKDFTDMELASGGAAVTEEQSQSSPKPYAKNSPKVGSAEFGIRKSEDVDQGSSKDHDSSPDQERGQSRKVPKLSASNSRNPVDQTDATMRKARVSVRVRTEDTTIPDGCHWRKYGQKTAKGNPCPRAYYRCTMTADCPVRKQVQRSAEDKTILISTYEGNHNHLLPQTALEMASTTSSAARVLLSGSIPSADGLLMNNNFLPRTLFPCSSSMATISASAPFPTITLDLTQSPDPLQMQRPPTPIQLPFPNPAAQNVPNAPPAALLTQIVSQALFNQSKFSGLQISSQNLESSQLGHPQILAPGQQGQHAPLADNGTPAIAADPNFTTALAAAITSVIGGVQPKTINNANDSNNGITRTSNGDKTSSSSFPGNQTS